MCPMARTRVVGPLVRGAEGVCAKAETPETAAATVNKRGKSFMYMHITLRASYLLDCCARASSLSPIASHTGLPMVLIIFF